jgi:DNA-binding MurR/RpiR family transcriptional regulator
MPHDRSCRDVFPDTGFGKTLPRFTRMERQLAEFVLDFPGDLPSYAASELAALAGVSNATVTRFIKRLGYLHYDDARRQVREARGAGVAAAAGQSQCLR